MNTVVDFKSYYEVFVYRKYKCHADRFIQKRGGRQNENRIVGESGRVRLCYGRLCSEAGRNGTQFCGLDASVIEEASSLKFIDVAFTGVDHIPVKEAKAKSIAISNASGYATQAVAELCISFMIQLLRNVGKTEERCREGGTKDGLIGNLLCGKTVGIVGTGAIGKRTAALCKAFGCRVIGFNRSKITDPVIDEQVSLEELLKQSDIVSLHCPLTEDTKGMIGEEQLKMMKKTALLINTARGAVVDSKALAKALEEGQIAGAASDVFEMEPPLPTDHPLLKHCICVERVYGAKSRDCI